MRSSRCEAAAVLAFAASALALCQSPQVPRVSADDPPARVARLSYLAGTVSFEPAGLEDWSPATLNYPVKADDRIWTEGGGRAELEAGNVTLRLGSATSFGFLGLDDGIFHVMLQQGVLVIRVRRLAKNEWVEVDSPNTAVTLIQPGLYRVGFDATTETTKVVVRGSEAEILVAGSTLRVEAKQQARVSGDADSGPTYDITEAAPPDDLEKWSAERDKRMAAPASTQYVARDVIGYEDLDANGSWTTLPEYGAVWQPTTVAVGWAPYRFGRWAWVEPWGWTWIDDAPWGFAPFHYGRWAFAGGAWVWVPGPIGVRHVWAPALVEFVGSGVWSASFGVGGGFAWFPLGPGEPFVPVYRVSPAYARRINATVTSVNVTNVTYVNRGVPGALTAVPRETIALSRPVAASTLAVSPGAVATVPVAGTAPALVPRAESVLAGPTGGAVARPPATVASRPIVTRRAPGPPPVPFAARQAALEAHPGRPVDAATLASLRQGVPSSRALVRTATAAAPAGLRPAREGLPPAQRLSAAAPARPEVPAPQKSRGKGKGAGKRPGQGKGQKGKPKPSPKA